MVDPEEGKIVFAGELMPGYTGTCIKKELEKAEQTIAEKTPTLEELEMALKKEQEKVPEREQLTEEIGKRQEKLAEYDELKKLQKQIKELEKQIEILKDRESRYQEKKAQMQVTAGTEKEFTGTAEGCGNKSSESYSRTERGFSKKRSGRSLNNMLKHLMRKQVIRTFRLTAVIVL